MTKNFSEYYACAVCCYDTVTSPSYHVNYPHFPIPLISVSFYRCDLLLPCIFFSLIITVQIIFFNNDSTSPQTPVTVSLCKEAPIYFLINLNKTGKALFIAPRGRTFEEFKEESLGHGWPSFRDEEVCFM